MILKIKNPILLFALFTIIATVITTILFAGVSIYKNYPSSSMACETGGRPLFITLVGDLLIGGGRVYDELSNNDFDPKSILGNFYDLLKSSDLLFANFEGIISEQHEAREKNLPQNFSVRSNPNIIDFFKNFENFFLSFANNHSADFGLAGIKDAVTLLSEHKIAYIGMGLTKEAATKPAVFVSPNVRVSFLAFTDMLPEEFYASDVHPGVTELTPDNLKQGINRAKNESDFVVVSLHTADRGNTSFSFFPDQHQQQIYHLAVDYGADLVIGQHPHGTQLFEEYKGKLIFYSLGIFLYDPSVSSRYPFSSPLFGPTQFKGGAILTAMICKEGLLGFDLLPVKMIISEDDSLLVIKDSFLQRIRAVLNRWYVDKENVEK